MAKDVRLPKLGQTMEEGTIVGCLVKVGDEIKKGDIIFEVETDKATLEMQSPADGFVKNILVDIGQALLVGDAIMVLGDKDEQVLQSFIDSLKTGAPVKQAQTVSALAAAEEAKQEMPQAEPAGRAKASPRAKMLAEELGVNLEKVVGTGPAGKIDQDRLMQFFGQRKRFFIIPQGFYSMGTINRIVIYRITQWRRKPTNEGEVCSRRIGQPGYQVDGGKSKK